MENYQPRSKAEITQYNRFLECQELTQTREAVCKSSGIGKDCMDSIVKELLCYMPLVAPRERNAFFQCQKHGGICADEKNVLDTAMESFWVKMMETDKKCGLGVNYAEEKGADCPVCKTSSCQHCASGDPSPSSNAQKVAAKTPGFDALLQHSDQIQLKGQNEDVALMKCRGQICCPKLFEKTEQCLQKEEPRQCIEQLFRLSQCINTRRMALAARHGVLKPLPFNI